MPSLSRLLSRAVSTHGIKFCFTCQYHYRWQANHRTQCGGRIVQGTADVVVPASSLKSCPVQLQTAQMQDTKRTACKVPKLKAALPHTKSA
jgi:hypothetical protein